MLPERQTKGFMLLCKPGRLLDDYERSDPVQKNKEYLACLRGAVSFINPRQYRGIARDALEPWSSTDEQLLQNGRRTLVDLRKNLRARRRFLEINGEDRGEWDYYVDGWDFNQALIADFDTARELHTTLDSPDSYEIVELCRDQYGTDYEFLGFDVGYWGSDKFSLICDTVVMPRWHPPMEEDFYQLSGRLRSLNQNVLFPTVEEAEIFRDYYRSCEWAEVEDTFGKFCIVQIAVPGV
jgi:hypothetical protein